MRDNDINLYVILLSLKLNNWTLGDPYLKLIAFPNLFGPDEKETHNERVKFIY